MLPDSLTRAVRNAKASPLYAQFFKSRAGTILSDTPNDSVNLLVAVSATVDIPADQTGTVTGANYVESDGIALRIFGSRIAGDTNTDTVVLLGVFIEYTSTI